MADSTIITFTGVHDCPIDFNRIPPAVVSELEANILKYRENIKCYVCIKCFVFGFYCYCYCFDVIGFTTIENFVKLAVKTFLLFKQQFFKCKIEHKVDSDEGICIPCHRAQIDIINENTSLLSTYSCQAWKPRLWSLVPVVTFITYVTRLLCLCNNFCTQPTKQ